MDFLFAERMRSLMDFDGEPGEGPGSFSKFAETETSISFAFSVVQLFLRNFFCMVSTQVSCDGAGSVGSMGSAGCLGGLGCFGSAGCAG